MQFATLLLTLLSINFAVSLPAFDPDSIEAYHIKTKRQTAGWCTFHYTQSKSVGDSTLFVYGPPVNGGSPPYLSNSINYANGVYSILPGYGDFLVATQDTYNNVTFRRHGTVSGDTWTVLYTDEGDNIANHICSVGVWAYNSYRTMNCGFQCTPFTGPYATTT